MYELKIYDKVDNGEFLISLGELIESIENNNPVLLEGIWEIVKGAYGYGEIICSIEGELSRNKQYQTDGNYIFPIIKSRKQYFYNVCMKKNDNELGVFDSTYLFLRSDSYIFLNTIKSCFRNTILQML